jgi:hypothetical protein
VRIPDDDWLEDCAETVLQALAEDATPDQIGALYELLYQAREGLPLRLKRQGMNRKKSKRGSITTIAHDLVLQLVEAGEIDPAHIELPHGFATEVAHRCQRDGIDVSDRYVQGILAAPIFKMHLAYHKDFHS